MTINIDFFFQTHFVEYYRLLQILLLLYYYKRVMDWLYAKVIIKLLFSFFS